jgi:long-chain acyl-CoA synthetase
LASLHEVAFDGGNPMSDDTAPSSAARAAAYLARLLEITLGDVGLSLPQYRLLGYLSRGSSAASPAARELSTSRPSVTALVDGVVAKGLVERLPDPGDRRKITLAMTASGFDALSQADTAITARLETVASYLPADDGAQALDGLGLWSRALRAEADRNKAVLAEGARR